jgi:hypothetical protein
VYSPQVTSPASKIPAGNVTRTTTQKPNAATTPVNNSSSGYTAQSQAQNTNVATPGSSGGSTGSNDQKYTPSYISELIGNPLDNFASYASLWTLAVLTPKQFNNPLSYRRDDAAFAGDAYLDNGGRVVQSGVVFSSAGRYDQYRVGTQYGAPEYFVNNFSMQSVIAPTQKTGNSNAISMSFDIFEPYSMGLFLQSLQNAAIKAGYLSYLDNAPYLLKLDFVGYRDDGTPVKIKRSKYFTCKILEVKFDVTESGSNYKVTAIPYNHQAFGRVSNTLYKDITLVGASVKELLATGEKSLSAFLNNEQKSNVTDGKQQAKASEYVFVFPQDAHDSIGLNVTESEGATSVTTNPFKYIPVAVISPPQDTTEFGNNPIGDSDMGFSGSSGGDYPMNKESEVYTEGGRVDTSKVQMVSNKRQFQFSQGQSITHIITQIILSSTFGRETFKKLNADGTLNWFKIDIQIQLLEYDVVAKDWSKKIIYRIVPYLVHSNVYMNPSSPPVGYQQLQQKIAKRYDYIYTGQNNNITKFDIAFNTAFFSGANSSKPEATANVANPGINAATKKDDTKFVSSPGSGVATATALTGIAPVKNDPGLLFKRYSGGSTAGSTEQKIAEAFQNSFLNSGDMITCNLELLGDPYWMLDSGIGNYIAPKINDAVTVDGTATYEGSEVYIYITFRTPSDVLENTGLMGFPNEGKISGFSGIYKVTECESKFQDGRFIQTLKMNRMPGQGTDFNIEKQPAENRSQALQVEEIGVISNTDQIPLYDGNDTTPPGTQFA